jgi:hypothetical protein
MKPKTKPKGKLKPGAKGHAQRPAPIAAGKPDQRGPLGQG